MSTKKATVELTKRQVDEILTALDKHQQELEDDRAAGADVRRRLLVVHNATTWVWSAAEDAWGAGWHSDL